jgi:anti-sigma factor RsiW
MEAVVTHHENGPGECLGLFERLSEYMDGELPADLCSRFDDHFRGCPRCVRFVEQMRQAVRLVEAMPCPGMPDRLKRSLIEAANSLEDDPET